MIGGYDDGEQIDGGEYGMSLVNVKNGDWWA